MTIKAILQLTLLLMLTTTSACTSFQPGTIDETSLRQRALTQETADLRVSVAVLGRQEAQQLFGSSLHEKGVQPVWLEVSNTGDTPYWLMLHGLDPNYFSAREVAYMSHRRFAGSTNADIDRFYSNLGMEQSLAPGTTHSGFAFSNETIGTKEVRVKLFNGRAVTELEFYAPVPGMPSEWEIKDLTALYDESEFIDVATETELHDAIRDLPLYTERETGRGDGDFLNVVLIGKGSILKSLISSGWEEAAFKTNLESLISSTSLYGRAPDVQFARTKRRVDSTSSLRLWLTPLRYNGQNVVLGSVKRDVDPNIDEAAIFLMENLGMAGYVTRFGAVTTIEEVPRDKPRKTFANDPYWTSGNRMVIEVTEDNVPLDQLQVFDWRWRGQNIFLPEDEE